MAAPTISVVTLTWNSARFVDPLIETLERDIESARRQAGIETEIICIDNGSSDDTLDKLRAHRSRYDNLQIIPLGANAGTTVSRNIGIRASAGDFVFILDSDTEIAEGTLAGLVGAAAELPDPDSIGIIHPKLVYPDGEFQESARRFPTVFTKLYRLLRMEGRRARDESIDAVHAGETVPVDYAISAAWFVPRATFEAVGLLDEDIFYAPEDVEFCARCWQHGMRVWYYPAVEVVHNCQRITNKRPFTRMGLSHARGLVHYWRRYGSFFGRQGGSDGRSEDR